MKQGLFRPLVARQVAVVVAAGVLLGTTLGILQLRAGLEHDRHEFRTAIDSVLSTAANSASLAAYELDAAQAQEAERGASQMTT